MKKAFFPMNLQFFAEPAGGEPGNNGGDGAQTPSANEASTSFDYEKLAQIIAGKQSVTEDTVLKGYFKQQGLSKEEMDQAIATFKEQKAANEPDVNALKQQIAVAQKQALQAQIDREAFMLSGELGVDLNTMPYLLKIADMTAVVGEDGNVSKDKLKESLNKVLEALPQLKNSTQQATGFVFGAPNGTNASSAVDDQLNRIFGTKKN